MRAARTALAAAVLAGLPALAGCAATSPPSGPQPTPYGVLVYWDTSRTDQTVAAEDQLQASCGLPAPVRTTVDSSRPQGRSRSYFRPTGAVLPRSLSSCLTASHLVLDVDVLSGPIGSGE